MKLNAHNFFSENTVVPYCGAAKCTCPSGYTYNEALNSCDPESGGTLIDNLVGGNMPQGHVL